MALSAEELRFRELKDMISKLNKTIESQSKLIESLQQTISQKEDHEKVLQEQIDYLTKKLFGRSSEKRNKDIPGQLSLFNEAEQEQNPSDTSDQEGTVTVTEHTRKKKSTHEEQFNGLKVNKIVESLPEEERICPVCGAEMEQIGEEFVRRELIYIPARCEINEYYRQSYGCPSCKKGDGPTEKPTIVKSEVKKAVIPKSFASESTVAWCIYQKFMNSIPLYRQEKDWKQYGVLISRTTLANWIIFCSEHYFKPLYEYFHRLLLKRTFLMADETRVQVLHEEGRKPQTQSFMWLFRSGEDGLPVIILYGYSPTRNGDNAKNFLDGFEGYLETDGYQGYNKVEGIKRCSCWSHIRRYFVDAIPKGKTLDYEQPAVQGVHYCDRLFHYEKIAAQKYPGDYEKRKQIRLEKEKPILEAFWSWLDEQHPRRNSRMEKAVNYALNRKGTAMTYLEDGRCSISNNLSENAIRPFTVGRKNWLFSNSVEGADASAICYTMVEMAKANQAKVYEYLNFVLSKRPDSTWTDKELESVTPWSEEFRKYTENLNRQ